MKDRYSNQNVYIVNTTKNDKTTGLYKNTQQR